MDIIRTNQLKNNIDKIVQLNGWVYNSRCSGKIGFLMFRDGFSIIQCIVSVNDVGEDKFDEFKPVINEDNMKTLHDIVRTKGAKPLKFRDGQIKVDIQTANIILKVLPRVKTKSTVDKMTTIINQGRKAQFIKLVSSLQGTLSGSFTNGIRNRPI